MFDWDEGDRFSFEDSDRFEEDSLCSWLSEPESVCNNWRGWKKQNSIGNYHLNQTKARVDGQLLSLVELSARVVACNIPFEVVEHVYPPVPEQLQLHIAFWSFPDNEEDIRLYSCLANGSSDEFQRGEHLFKTRAIKDLLQIGFHLSASVVPPQTLSVSKGSYNVAVTFDRCRITSCNCTCTSIASWCSHVVAVCLQRIHQPNQVCLRAPVSESLSRLRKDQLQKFAQYLISELPQQILPTAQRLLDELLSNQQTKINTVCGAPDPTAGASVHEQTTWCLDEGTLHENIHKILIKLCVPSPMVFSDVNYLSSTAPPAAAEWSSLLRPLRGREPEGMWNLLSIVREMSRRNDRNAIALLEILTEEVLGCDQILVWWFNTKVSLHMGYGGHGGRGSVHSNTQASQHACSSLCDEIVVLWRLAALNPALLPQDRQAFFNQLREWHVRTLDKVGRTRNGIGGGGINNIKRVDIEVFPGFKPAIEACLLDWSDYPIPGVTYTDCAGRKWCLPYTHMRLADHGGSSCSEHPSGLQANLSNRRGRSVDIGQTSEHCTAAERKAAFSHVVSGGHHHCAHNCQEVKNESNRSSFSSEGFCENETLDALDANSCQNFKPNGSGLDERMFVVHPSEINGQQSDDSKDEDGKLDIEDATNKEDSEKQTDEKGTLVHSDVVQVSGKIQDASPPKDLPQDYVEEGISLVGQNSVLQLRPNRTSHGHNLISSSHSNCDSVQRLYYFDPQAIVTNSDNGQEKRKEENNFSVTVKKIEDPLEVLFARAEALHAHGHTQEACKLAVRLAEELLANPPDLMVDILPPPTKGKRGRRFNPASHQISLLASATLAKAAFLCSVLGENQEHHHLAFRVGMFGLEMARPPASTKALEVKLANQEQDLVYLLKRLPLTEVELEVVRKRAEQLRDGHLRSRGEALLPLMLSTYIFDALVLSDNSPVTGHSGTAGASRSQPDETLGFEAAVVALGVKANVSEADHPLLCEGTRRQRGELAVSLLLHYKDNQEKLAKIMDKLLDKEVHQLYKSPGLSAYYASSPNTQNVTDESNQTESGTCSAESPNIEEIAEKELSELDAGSSKAIPKQFDNDEDAGIENESGVSSFLRSESNGTETAAKSLQRQNYRNRSEPCDRSEDASSPFWEEEDYKVWEAKFRCTNFRTNKKHSAGMASIDSSAPETTSSDNSPTVVRRTWMRPGGPGSDSGSSGGSSDSFASSSSGDKGKHSKPRDSESPPQPVNPKHSSPCPPLENYSRSLAPCKVTRFKGKRAYPNVPNQPSEASAHFMFELAKTVLTKAGGNSSTAVLFTQPSASQNHRGPHRALHMCAFQIGLYALGLHNAVSPNWLSRTYSSQVSWITGQAMEIGTPAINFLIETWEGHLTPPEVASLADRASRGRDPSMVRVAAQLALSCLPHAHALNPNEIQRALIQCKEQSNEMLERACLAIESAAKGGGVSPEVLFDTARKWYELYEESLSDQRGRDSDSRIVSNAQIEVGSINSTAERPNHSGPVNQLEGIVPSPPSLQIIPQFTCPPPSYALAYPPYGYLQGVPHLPVPYHPYFSAAAPAPPPTYPYSALTNSPYYTAATTATHIRPPPAGLYSGRVLGVSVSQAAMSQTRPVLPMNGQAVAAAPSPALSPSQPAQQMQGPVSQLNQCQMNYLLSAYRVGMLAMEMLARRVHDDRPQAKYARNPPYGEDVKWLLSVAKKLGTSYIQEFCICTVNSVVSPFVLHDIVVEASHYLARSGSAPALTQPLRSHLLTPLIQKCQQMFIACTHFKMYHITPAEYEEFVNIIRSARAAFQMTPGGMVQFNELLQSLRRSKSCKKDLWQRIANALATVSI